MAKTPLQTAQEAWQRRAGQFQSQGVPQNVWGSLYQRDMAGVYSGSQGMSDAEVYTAVQSAWKGPQIADPQQQHGHGGGIMGVLSGIADTVGNVPHDIEGIITGFPHGLAHAVWDLPQEIPDTWQLITHLGDTQWMIQKGYLQKGDTAHGAWGDLGQILREMNGDQQHNLLPYLPFLSDLANMTSGQGRSYLMQHPVGTLMDAWPGVGKLGKLSVAGMDIKPPEAMPEGLATTDPKFYSAARALKAGNPLKAAVSAVGDLLPGGRDKAGIPMTLRDRTVHLAHVAGLGNDMKSIVGATDIAQQEVGLQKNKFYSENFGSEAIKSLTPEEREEMFLGRSGMNPVTHKPFTPEEYKAWRISLSPEKNALLDAVTNAEEAQRQTEIDSGLMKQFTGPDGVQHYEPFNSPVYKSYQKWADAKEALDNYLNKLHEMGPGWGDVAAGTKEMTELGAKVKAAQNTYFGMLSRHIPLEGQVTAQSILRQRIEEAVRQDPSLIKPGWNTTHNFSDAFDLIAHSRYNEDFERLLGKDEYEKMVGDSIQAWRALEKQSGGKLTFLRHVDPEHVRRVLHPHVDPADKHLPEQHKLVGKGIMLQRSVMDPVVALTHAQAELYKHMVVNKLVDEHVSTLAAGKDVILNQYSMALRKAVATGVVHMTDAEIANKARELLNENYTAWSPRDFGGMETKGGDQVIAKNIKAELDILLGKKSPALQTLTGNRVVRKGTALYKFAVLTGPRHLAHVAFGGLAFLEGRYPLAPRNLMQARALLRGELDPRTLGLDGLTLSGLRGKVYQTGHDDLEKIWSHAAGQQLGQDLTHEGLHEAKEAGVGILEWFPNKLAKLEENIMDMYRVMGFLEAKRGGLEGNAALEAANKVFVDIHNMSVMERMVIKQIFPFYAFTRHLFRYLFSYPVDYPLRASIITQFAETEQNDWNNGLPRSYQSLFFLPFHSIAGIKIPDGAAIDTKNLNPFRSFANDFSLAGFYSSLSPFLTAPLAAIGVDTLSGTTQLYPGTTYNPQTGTIQATAPSGGLITFAEAFVPQLGLLDHYLGLTAATRSMARYNKDAYNKQLYNMLNIPFVPNVVDVPYEQEITEMRRFRAAQGAVTAVEKNPSAANVAKLMEWNAVPFNNTLISPGSLAAYYEAVQTALNKANKGYIAPKAAVLPPTKKKAVITNF